MQSSENLAFSLIRISYLSSSNYTHTILPVQTEKHKQNSIKTFNSFRPIKNQEQPTIFQSDERYSPVGDLHVTLFFFYHRTNFLASKSFKLQTQVEEPLGPYFSNKLLFISKDKLCSYNLHIFLNCILKFNCDRRENKNLSLFNFYWSRYCLLK